MADNLCKNLGKFAIRMLIYFLEMFWKQFVFLQPYFKQKIHVQAIFVNQTMRFAFVTSFFILKAEFVFCLGEYLSFFYDW